MRCDFAQRPRAEMASNDLGQEQPNILNILH